jgi:hypothetical protein
MQTSGYDGAQFDAVVVVVLLDVAVVVVLVVVELDVVSVVVVVVVAVVGGRTAQVDPQTPSDAPLAFVSAA